MIAWTSPTHQHTLKGIDLTECRVWVSYRQPSANGDVNLDVEVSEVTYDGQDTTVAVYLTQEQTGAFGCGPVQVQVNWVYPNGKRDAVVIKTIVVGRNLIPEVLGYEH